MELYEHHKVNDNGELAGLYTVDIHKGTFTHEDLWGRIDQIIYEYYQLHPIEMENLINENRQFSENQLNKHGVGNSKNLEIRYHMRIPVGLMRVLESIAPELFENKENYHKFIKRYKALAAFTE